MPDDETRDDSERALVLVGYGLFLFAITNGLTALIGAVIAYIRRDEALGTIWRDHYDNMIKVFWVSAIFMALGLAMAFTGLFATLGLALGTAWLDGSWLLGLPLLGAAVPLVLLAGMVLSLWYLYRIIRGLLRALDDKPY